MIPADVWYEAYAEKVAAESALRERVSKRLFEVNDDYLRAGGTGMTQHTGRTHHLPGPRASADSSGGGSSGGGRGGGRGGGGGGGNNHGRLLPGDGPRLLTGPVSSAPKAAKRAVKSVAAKGRGWGVPLAIGAGIGGLALGRKYLQEE